MSAADTDADPADAAYRDVLASLSEGLIVQFNASVPGTPETPELTVLGVWDDNALLGDHADAVPTWEVRYNEGDTPEIYEHDGGHDPPDYYEDVVSIEVVGYDG